MLTPLKHWLAGDLSCYYAQYDAQFSGGGSEQGVIPWPVCYPRNADAMIHPAYPHDLPVPFPPPGYVLPAGKYLTPLLEGLYDRTE